MRSSVLLLLHFHTTQTQTLGRLRLLAAHRAGNLYAPDRGGSIRRPPERAKVYQIAPAGRKGVFAELWKVSPDGVGNSAAARFFRLPSPSTVQQFFSPAKANGPSSVPVPTMVRNVTFGYLAVVPPGNFTAPFPQPP